VRKDWQPGLADCQFALRASSRAHSKRAFHFESSTGLRPKHSYTARPESQGKGQPARVVIRPGAELQWNIEP
jgi:hypothetical protein